MDNGKKPLEWSSATIADIKTMLGVSNNLNYIPKGYLEPPAYTGVTGAGMSDQQHGTIYDLYDALITAYPQKATRNLLGYATDAAGGNDETLPIYEYVFSTANEITFLNTDTEQFLLNPAPVIILSSGVHGVEKISVQALYEFIKNVLENYATDDKLSLLYSNFIIKIIPIANPYGYDHNSRNNARDVNPARNMGDNWADQTGYDTDKKGIAPYSENETQILRDWMIANRTCVFYVDFHDSQNTVDVSNNAWICYHYSFNQDLTNLYSAFIRSFSDKIRVKYSFEDNDNIVYGWTSIAYFAGTFAEAYNIQGIRNSSVCEINRTLYGTSYSQMSIEIQIAQILNYIILQMDYLTS